MLVPEGYFKHQAGEFIHPVMAFICWVAEINIHSKKNIAKSAKALDSISYLEEA